MKKVAWTVPALLASAATAVAQSQTPGEAQSVEQLQKMVNSLQSQVDELKAASNQNWLTEKRAEEIRGLVQDVLADADTRSSLLQSGVAAGWDKGFFIGSADGNWRLNVGGQLQVRYVYNFQDESPVDNHRNGFEIRRAKMIMTGNIVDPSWTFDVQFAADRSSGNVTLEDAGWLQKDLGDGWKIRVGQQKAPFAREELISSRRLFAVERSLLNSQFTAGTVQGVQLGYEGDQFRAYAMYHDGQRTANTAWSAEDTEFAMSGRVEWLAQGDWKSMVDYSSFKGEESAILLGAAVHYQKAEYGTGMNLPFPDFNNAEAENLGFTGDVTVDFGGASLAGVVFYRMIDVDATGTDLDQWGFLVRGGFFIADDWELYGQYEWGDLDVDSIEELSIITVGITKYWDKHNLKWQSDVGWSINEVAASWAQDSAGWRADADGEDGQIVIRSQIQLLF